MLRVLKSPPMTPALCSPLTNHKLIRAHHANIVSIADVLAARALVEEAADAH